MNLFIVKGLYRFLIVERAFLIDVLQETVKLVG